MKKQHKDLLVVTGISLASAALVVWATNNNDRVNKALGAGGITGIVTRLFN